MMTRFRRWWLRFLLHSSFAIGPGCFGQFKPKAAPFARRRFHPYPAPHFLYAAFDDGQPNARSRRAARRTQPLEHAKNPFAIFWVQAHTVVLDANADTRAFSFR